MIRGAWVAQLVKCPTLDLSLHLELRVLNSGFKRHVGLQAGHEAYLKKTIENIMINI